MNGSAALQAQHHQQQQNIIMTPHDDGYFGGDDDVHRHNMMMMDVHGNTTRGVVVPQVTSGDASATPKTSSSPQARHSSSLSTSSQQHHRQSGGERDAGATSFFHAGHTASSQQPFLEDHNKSNSAFPNTQLINSGSVNESVPIMLMSGNLNHEASALVTPSPAYQGANGQIIQQPSKLTSMSSDLNGENNRSSQPHHNNNVHSSTSPSAAAGLPPVAPTSPASIRAAQLALQHQQQQQRSPNIAATGSGGAVPPNKNISFSPNSYDVSPQQNQLPGNNNNNNNRRNSIQGTVAYSAPEASSHAFADDKFASDVWSLGLTLYTLLYSRLPWPLFPVPDFVHHITTQDIPFPPVRKWASFGNESNDVEFTGDDDDDEFCKNAPLAEMDQQDPEGFPDEEPQPELIELLRKMLVRDPAERISIEEARIEFKRLAVQYCPSVDLNNNNNNTAQPVGPANSSDYYYYEGGGGNNSGSVNPMVMESTMAFVPRDQQHQHQQGLGDNNPQTALFGSQSLNDSVQHENNADSDSPQGGDEVFTVARRSSIGNYGR